MPIQIPSWPYPGTEEAVRAMRERSIRSLWPERNRDRYDEERLCDEEERLP